MISTLAASSLATAIYAAHNFLYAAEAIDLILAAGAYASAMRLAESSDEPDPEPPMDES